MKSLTRLNNQKLVAARDAQVEIASPVAGVLNDVRSAFFGLCVNAGKAVLTAMMEEVPHCVVRGRAEPNALGVSRWAHAQPSDAGWAAHRIARPRKTEGTSRCMLPSTGYFHSR